MGPPVIKAVITTLDNLPTLREQVAILQDDPLIHEIVVTNNGSTDGTRDWLRAQPAGLKVLNRANRGAGPGRNAGLDAAGRFDYVLMLDGGVRPLVDGARHMLDYLERRTTAGVIGLEIADLQTQDELSLRRWPGPITDEQVYLNRRQSHTAYGLARWRAFDGLRFSELGPFAEPGWGVDDDEMAYQWNEAGIEIHVVTGVGAYRRASGSFERLFRETGVWPNQYGSVYEQRLVWCQQNWPQHCPGTQWGEPWLTVVIAVGAEVESAGLIKEAHDALRRLRFSGEWAHVWKPYSIVAWCSREDPFVSWALPRCLRQHHGDAATIEGKIVRRTDENERTWTGDFRLWHGGNYHDAIRESSNYYALVRSRQDLHQVLRAYDRMHSGDDGPHCFRHEVNPMPEE